MEVWDDLRRGARAVVDEGRRLGEVARLKAQLALLEGRRQDRLADLGRAAMELQAQGTLQHEGLTAASSAVAAVDTELAALQAELAALTAEAPPATGRSCRGCGEPAAGGDRFCRQCGAPLQGDA
ncbi:MAG: zinc ribbon domain-containing protein [Fimbriimonadaceae bacterium]|nr:zinc ribbon domain-containing protein [Fimbriimonadaceae bacterium]